MGTPHTSMVRMRRTYVSMPALGCLHQRRFESSRQPGIHIRAAVNQHSAAFHVALVVRGALVPHTTASTSPNTLEQTHFLCSKHQGSARIRSRSIDFGAGAKKRRCEHRDY